MNTDSTAPRNAVHAEEALRSLRESLEVERDRSARLRALIDFHTFKYEQSQYGQHVRVSRTEAGARLGEIWEWFDRDPSVVECALVLLPNDIGGRLSDSSAVVALSARSRKAESAGETTEHASIAINVDDGWSALAQIATVEECIIGNVRLRAPYRVVATYFLYKIAEAPGESLHGEVPRHLDDFLDIRVARTVAGADASPSDLRRWAERKPEGGRCYQQVVAVFGCDDDTAAGELEGYVGELLKLFIALWGFNIEERDNLLAQDRARSHEIGQVTQLLDDNYVLPFDEFNQRVAKLRGIGYPVEQGALGIVSGELLLAVRDYLHIWAPPKRLDSSSVLARVGILREAREILKEASELARQAGFVYQGRKLRAKDVVGQHELRERYMRDTLSIVECPPAMACSAYLDRDDGSSRRLFFRALAAACLNGIKHSGYAFETPRPVRIVLAVIDPRRLLIANTCAKAVEEEFAERHDADGSLAILRATVRRVSSRWNVRLGALPDIELPNGIEQYAQMKDVTSPFWCKTVFEFDGDFPFCSQSG